MAIIIGGARHDENGNYVNGQAGDQLQSGSGDDYSGECSLCEFYVHKYGWYVLHPKTAELANKLAERMLALCNNKHIGYDQNNRDGIIKYGIDTTTDTECDCSSGVRECVKEASGKDPGDFTTSNEVSVLEATGLFDAKYAYTSGTKLYVGDILCSQQKGHTVIVCYGYARTSDSSGSTGSTGSGTTGSSKTMDDAKYGPDNSISGTYTVTASGGLNVRYGIGKDVIVAIPKGTEVRNYGYYNKDGNVKWLYVQFVYGGYEYTGYASSEYLEKKPSSGSSSGSSGSSLPTYTVGNTYTTQVDHLAVRSTPEVKPDNKYAKSQLTSNGQANAHSDGCLKQGTKVTCQATKTVNGDIWMQIPSGWIAAYYNGNKYVK